MSANLADLRSRLSAVRVFATPAARRRFVVHALVVAVALVLLTILFRREFALLADPRELRAFVRGFGAWGPLVLVALQAAQVVIAPVPGQVLAVAAGYLYGAWWGTLYNVVGVAIGSTIAFWLSRRYGRGYVERVVHDDLLASFDALDDRSVVATLFVLFLVPGLPDDVICFAGGLSRVPIRRLVVVAVVGRAPGFFLVNVVGEMAYAGDLEAALVLSSVLVAVSVVCYLERDRILGYVGVGG